MGLFSRKPANKPEPAETRKFDLNIEEVLDGWEVKHAIREIIANALDEQILTNTADMEIRQTDEKMFVVRDRGRGIKPEHLTQNENPEKMSGKAPVIGRFGVGLKDALAVLNRRGVKVRIASRHCTLTTKLAKKHGFDGITTLHALVGPPDDAGMDGTEVVLENVQPVEVNGAKALFRKFNEEEGLESTKYGDVLRRKKGETGRIYINGVRVATEDNFLFSYDITKPTEAMRRRLNRERTNVGRGAYTERVKAILLEVKNPTVIGVLARDVGGHETGHQHDETKWVDVATRACKLLNADDKVVFATAGQQREMPNLMEYARDEGRKVITVPDSVGGKLIGATDEAGGAVYDMRQYSTDLNERFEFKFVDPTHLTLAERRVWNRTSSILGLVGAQHLVGGLRISETMRPGALDADGLWDGERITVKRSTLSDLGAYAGVLLHEAAHATGGGNDATLGFEMDLTRMLGRVAVLALERG